MAIAVRAAVLRGDARPALVGHDHDARYDARYAPLGGGGGGGAEVTITGTEGVTVVESPVNTFTLGLTASPDASNTVEIRANGIYSASGAIPPEYVTDAELATALGPYATDADLAAHAAAADPHPTYLTAAEGNSAYALTGHHHDAAYYNVAGDSLAGHMTVGTHNAYDIGATGARLRKLWAVDGEFTTVPTVGGVSLDSRYATPASVTSAISTHEGATNPHPMYATDTDLSAALARITTLEGQVATLQSRMTGHTHLSGTIAAAGGVAVMP